MKLITRKLSVGPGALFVVLIAFALYWGVFVSASKGYFLNYDQADTALAAKNLVLGNGLTTDSTWLYYKDWGSLRHPEDVWPLMQSIVAAGFFLVFGASAASFVASVFFFGLLLLIATYIVGERVFGRWRGLIAAVFVFFDPTFLGLISVGTNDVGAAFFYLVAIYALYLSLEEEDKRYKWTIIAAIATGLGILQKFQGVFIVIAYGAWRIGGLRKEPRVSIKKSLVYLAVLAAVGSPFMIRNLEAFGTPSYPSSKIVNGLSMAWDSDVDRWRMDVAYYKFYWEHEKPGYAYYVKHRGWKYVLYDRPAFVTTRLLHYLASFVIVKEIPFLFAILGFFVALEKRRKWALWCLVVALSLESFPLFGHVEPRYFFILVPLAALFAAEFLVWSRDNLFKSKVAHGAFIALLAYWLLTTNWGTVKANMIRSRFEEESGRTIGVVAMFLNRNLAPGEGFYSHHAAELAFHSDRYGGLLPNEDLAKLIEFSDRYKIRYIVFDNAPAQYRLMTQPGAQYWVMFDLAPLLLGREVYGFKKVVTMGNEYLIYRIPRPNEVDLAKLPKLPPDPDDFTLLVQPPAMGGGIPKPPPLGPDGERLK